MNMLAQLEPQKTISIDGVQIRQDQYGRYCLNDLHVASGGLDKNKPSNFLRQDQIQNLVAEIERCSDVSNGINAIETIRGGSNQGTYVVKQIVYAYAMWISASFNLKVINTFDVIVTQKQINTPHDYLSALKALVESEEQKQAAIHQLELAAPKVAHYDAVVAKGHLLTATQIGAKIGLSAVALNRVLDNFRVYNKAHKRSRVFNTWFEDQGFGELKQTTTGHSQPMFTTKGEAWVIEKLASEGIAA